jgi:hypothetical protein
VKKSAVKKPSPKKKPANKKPAPKQKSSIPPAEFELRLAQCEERRQCVLRGDALIGIMPVEEIEQMVQIYRALGEAGVAAAWVGLGEYHLDASGVDLSLADATECACRAAALGSAEGRLLLLRVLFDFRADGYPDPAHAREARQAVEAAAATDSLAAYLAGLLAFHGFGGKKDLKAAVRHHQAAAALGNTDAMFELYVHLSTGTGVPKDEAAALAWCEKAAALGHARACYNLGAFYATGRGVPKDAAKSLAWYEKAAQAGNGRATATLAYMVISGEGCPADPVRGEALFAQAAGQGFDVEGFRAQVGV